MKFIFLPLIILVLTVCSFNNAFSMTSSTVHERRPLLEQESVSFSEELLKNSFILGNLVKGETQLIPSNRSALSVWPYVRMEWFVRADNLHYVVVLHHNVITDTKEIWLYREEAGISSRRFTSFILNPVPGEFWKFNLNQYQFNLRIEETEEDNYLYLLNGSKRTE